MPTEDLIMLIRDRALPVVRRGYDQTATDDLLGRLEEGLRSVLSTYAGAQARLVELEKRIAEGREREQEITEALVVAARVRAESEKEGEKVKADYLREAEAIETESQRKADSILNAAEERAKEIVTEARLKARGYEQEIRETEQLAEETRVRLASFLESMLEEIQRRGTDLSSTLDDLLVRTGESAGADGGRVPGSTGERILPFDER